MDKKQMNARITELMRLVVPDIKQECKRLLATGALEYSREDSRSYRTAKTVVAVAMQNIAAGISSFNSEDAATRKNLKNF